MFSGKFVALNIILKLVYRHLSVIQTLKVNNVLKYLQFILNDVRLLFHNLKEKVKAVLENVLGVNCSNNM